MASTKRLLKSIFRLLFPILILVLLSFAVAAVWLDHTVSRPPQNIYLLTPDKYGQLSARGAQVTDENWTNPDNTTARGWLLRGSTGAPAVILLHKFGADRSHVLNLGVKLNEATGYTVLLPDLRGHGQNPSIPNSSFGGAETEDTLAAIKFLRELKNQENAALVGSDIGIYGVELGSLIAVNIAAKDPAVKVLVLDSVPLSSDEIMSSAVKNRYPFGGSITSKLAQNGTYLYFAGGTYRREETCQVVKTIGDRRVFLLAGADEEDLRDATEKISRCFHSSNKIERKTDLNPSGYNLGKATLEQADAYDQRVIAFFKQSFEQ